MSLRLPYLIFAQVLGLVLLMGRTSASKDIELLVRHEVAVLLRRAPLNRPGGLNFRYRSWARRLAQRGCGKRWTGDKTPAGLIGVL